MINNNQSFVIDECLPYGYILRIGAYEGYSIYTLTNPIIQQAKEIRNT